jgi:hypothetical protein
MEDRIWEVASQLFTNCGSTDRPLEYLELQLGQLRADRRWTDSDVQAIERRAHCLLLEHTAARHVSTNTELQAV